MRTRNLVALTLVVAALAAFVYFFERDLPSTDTRRERASRLVPLDPDQLTDLTLEWEGQTVELSRASADDDWRLVAPLTGRADRPRVDRLLANLAQLDVERVLDGVPHADVGLEPPRGAISWSGGQSGRIDIGGDVPASSNVVVAASGRPDPAVVAAGFAADLATPPGDWRSREVLGIGRDRVARVRLLSAALPQGAAIELERRGEGFLVAAPFVDVADRDRVDPLLAEATGLRAERFADEPLPAEVEASLQAGPGSVELVLMDDEPPAADGGAPPSTGSGQTVRLDLGAATEAGERWVRLGDLVFAARTRLAESLTEPAERWRSPRWSRFDAWRVERLRISEPNEPELTLVREGGEWKRGEATVGYTEVGDLLHELTRLKAQSVLTPEIAARRPLTPPQLTAVLGDAAGDEETLTLHGEAEGATVEARVSGRDVVLLLPIEAVAALRARLAAVRSPAPAPAAPASIDDEP